MVLHVYFLQTMNKNLENLIYNNEMNNNFENS